MYNIARGKINRRSCTCAILQVHAAAVIFQLLVDFVPKVFFAVNCQKYSVVTSGEWCKEGLMGSGWED